jgi:hypothetical protein
MDAGAAPMVESGTALSGGLRVPTRGRSVGSPVAVPFRGRSVVKLVMEGPTDDVHVEHPGRSNRCRLTARRLVRGRPHARGLPGDADRFAHSCE